ncbi:MAG TPA: peptidylprolyl isomerase, partial [Candidatus Udaeobacter sp.]|nr:peptidylprolyl isomerase [Candidatus Udaeobacter sp.]
PAATTTKAAGEAGTATTNAATTAVTTNKSGDKALMMIDEMIAKAKVDKSKADWRTTLTKPEMATFDAGHTYLAHMTTTKGPITIKFMPKVAPMHVTSFIYLSRLGFYDGLAFHRVIPGFMAQGGCPLGTGTGGPGYKFAGEFDPAVKHDKGGYLSMANAGPGTDGSQFFLTFVATPWLDGKHTIFGEVTEGKDTLKALEAAGSESGQTKEPLKIDKVTIEVK